MLLNQPNATALPRKADLQMLYNRLTLGGASTAPLGNNADNPYVGRKSPLATKNLLEVTDGLHDVIAF